MNHEHMPGEEVTPEQHPSSEPLQPLNPRIWVGSLADYNNGDLHGDWLDAARPAADIYTDIERILASGPAARAGDVPEEWGIFDFDEFGGLQIGEYARIEDVSRLADGVATYGEPFARWADAVGSTEADLSRFVEHYRGHFASPAAYAEELVFDMGGEGALQAAPNWLRPYILIDHAALARDMELNAEITCLKSSDGGVYVFDGHI